MPDFHVGHRCFYNSRRRSAFGLSVEIVSPEAAGSEKGASVIKQKAES
jgi:hypothetical protein